MLPRSAQTPTALFWFLVAFVLHALASTLLFAIALGAPDGPGTTALLRAFTVLQWPVAIPLLSSVLWAAVIALLAAVIPRRSRRPPSRWAR
jgi:hypothetical protein